MPRHGRPISAIALCLSSIVIIRPPLRLFRLGSLLIIGFLLLSPIRAAEFDLQNATIADINAAFDAHALTSEKLTALELKRIETYEPKLHAVITLNPKALDEARALDAERKAKGPRSPLHGIPVVLKDNYNTTDLQTTGGFYGLKGSLPPADATIVAKLRQAGAIVLAKVNMSEFASGGAMSSLGGQSHNPHNLDYTPAGSSGGTGVSIAAAYAPLGYGTDTGGSIRGPSTANGVVGLKPTLGLLSRAGIIPLALSFDTGGPIARSVYDIAVSLNVTTGVDPRDDATQKSTGKAEKDYTKFLDKGALKGARIGLASDFLGVDPEVDVVIESAIGTMRLQGAEIVYFKYPPQLLLAKTEIYNAIRRPEFKWQIQDYLSTLKPGFPKTHADILALSEKITAPTPDGVIPNPTRLASYRQEALCPPLTDPIYLATKNEGLAFVRATVLATIADNKLDAIVYPTSSRRPAKIGAAPEGEGGSGRGRGGSTETVVSYDGPGPHPALGSPPAPSVPPGAGGATNIANLTGFPDLIVPAGFSVDGLPIGISFFGPAFSEPKLLAYGYAFEQATHALRQPVNTPSLPGEKFTY